MMQRGIRLNPKSTALWREYLRLELLFWNKVLRRREILGLPTKPKEAIAEQGEDGNAAVPSAVSTKKKAKKEIPDEDDSSDSDDDDEVSRTSSHHFHVLGVACTCLTLACTDPRPIRLPPVILLTPTRTTLYRTTRWMPGWRRRR